MSSLNKNCAINVDTRYLPEETCKHHDGSGSSKLELVMYVSVFPPSISVDIVLVQYFTASTLATTLPRCYIMELLSSLAVTLRYEVES